MAAVVSNSIMLDTVLASYNKSNKAWINLSLHALSHKSSTWEKYAVSGVPVTLIATRHSLPR